MNTRLANTNTKTTSKKPYILVVRDLNEGVAHKQFLIKQSPNDELSEQSDYESDRVSLQNTQVAYYDNKESDESDLIWSHKKNTEQDAQATEYFLQLRGEEKYKQLFADKKFGKFKLWMEIANEMNNAGYYVGDGREAAERCRQKFSNLEKSFLKYIRHIRSDARNKREPPPYYEYMVNLVDPDDRLYRFEQSSMLDAVRDSLQVELLSSNSKDNNLPSSSKNIEALDNHSDFSNEKQKKNKQHTEIITLLNKQHSEIMSVQREFLEKIDKHLSIQNEQREKMMNSFMNAMKSNCCECDNKKRKLNNTTNEAENM